MGPVAKKALAKKRFRQDRKKQKALGGEWRKDIDNEFITSYFKPKNSWQQKNVEFNSSWLQDWIESVKVDIYQNKHMKRNDFDCWWWFGQVVQRKNCLVSFHTKPMMITRPWLLWWWLYLYSCQGYMIHFDDYNRYSLCAL